MKDASFNYSGDEIKIIEATEEQLNRLTRLYEDSLASDKRVINIFGLSLEEWLILRSIAGVGSSEVATALGLVPSWFSSTPLSLWKEKVGHIIKSKDNAQMRIGRNIEEVIVKEYEATTGIDVMRVKDFMFIHPEIDYLFTNLDGLIHPVAGDGWGILECKNTVSYVCETWKLKLPTYYFRQAMNEISVLNQHPFLEGASVEFVDFAVFLLDKRSTEIIRINKDGEFIRKQNIEVGKFWQRVKNNIPPEPSVAEYAVEAPMEDSFTLATEEAYNKVQRIIELSKQIKALQDEKDELSDAVKQEIGDSESLVYENEIIATWKAQQRETIDSKRLKIEEPEIAKKYSKTSVVRVFKPKEVEVLSY